MSTRFKLLIAAAIFSVICGQRFAYATQEDGDLVANKKATLSTDELIAQPVQPPAPIEKPKDESADYPPASIVLPSNESVALGKPNNIFSSRPTSETDRSKSNPLTALDPRENDITRAILALGIVMFLLLGLRAALRRFGGPLTGGKPSGVLEVLGRFPAGRGQHLVLLKLGRRIVLAYQTKGSMSLLSEISDPDEVADLIARIEAGSRQTRNGKFQSILGGLTSAESTGQWDELRLGRSAKTGFGGNEVIDLTRRSRKRFSADARKQGAA